MSLEVLVEIFNNISGKMKVAASPPILDTLDSDRNLTEKSEFDTTKGKLLALQICHGNPE